MQKQYSKGDISKLLDIMTALRTPVTGCPWDLEQDFHTIAQYTLEEAYEVADCIERGALDELPDELGDLLLQVVFHAQIAADRGLFGFAEVVEQICDKMIRRHPHVFGNGEARTSQEVAGSWDQIKRSEKPATEALLAGIAIALPALTRAHKLGKRAATVGFDWPDAQPVRAKIDEELAELDEAVAANDGAEIEAEMGDLIFSLVNYCRHLGIDPERALRRANDRFATRFGRVEDCVRARGGDWDQFGASELDDFWRRAKSTESG